MKKSDEFGLKRIEFSCLIFAFIFLALTIVILMWGVENMRLLFVSISITILIVLFYYSGKTRGYRKGFEEGEKISNAQREERI